MSIDNMTLSKPNDAKPCMDTMKVLFKQVNIGTMPSYMAYSLEDYRELVIIRDALINATTESRETLEYKNTYVLDIYEYVNGVRTYIPLHTLVDKYLSGRISEVDMKLLNRVSKILLIKITDII